MRIIPSFGVTPVSVVFKLFKKQMSLWDEMEDL